MRQTEFYLSPCDPQTLTVGQMMQDPVTPTDGSTLASLMPRRNFGSLSIVE